MANVVAMVSKQFCHTAKAMSCDALNNDEAALLMLGTMSRARQDAFFDEWLHTSQQRR